MQRQVAIRLLPLARCLLQRRGSPLVARSVNGQRISMISHRPPVPPRSAKKYALVSALSLSAGGLALGYLFPPFEMAFHPAPGKPITARRLDIPRHPAQQEIENQLRCLQAVDDLRMEARDRGEGDLWTESRLFYPPPSQSSHLVAGALLGASKITVPPLVRTKKDGTQAAVVLHVGNDVCGYEGIIHGGLIATLFDQHLANLGMLSLPSKTGVTANLNVNYYSAAAADQFLIFRLAIDKLQTGSSKNRRKAVVTGRLETTEGKLLADARAVIVEPRDIKKFMKPQHATSAAISPH